MSRTVECLLPYASMWSYIYLQIHVCIKDPEPENQEMIELRAQCNEKSKVGLVGLVKSVAAELTRLAGF